jgi:hypothetical protein
MHAAWIDFRRARRAGRTRPESVAYAVSRVLARRGTAGAAHRLTRG